MAETFPKSGILTADVFATFDVAMPEVSDILTSRFGKQYMPFTQKLRKMGREEGVAADAWYNYEDNWIHETIKIVSAAVVDGSNTKKGVTLKIDITNGFYPRVGDVVTVPGTLDQCLVTSIASADEIVIVPFDETVELLASGTTLVASAIVAITSGAFAQGTDQPSGTLPGMVKRDFQLQIIKETVGLTGSQLINQTWLRVFDDNRNVIGYYTPGTMRAEEILGLKIDGALTVGQKATNVGSTGFVRQNRIDRWGQSTGVATDVKTTKGFIPIITELGNSQNYGASGTFSITDFDDQCFYLRSQATTSGAVYAPLGARLYADVQEELKDYAIDQSGAGSVLNSVMGVVGKGDVELATSLNFRYVNRNGFSFALDIIDGWSNPKYLGATGYDMDKKGLFIPLKQVRDPKANIMIDNMVIKYRANATYNRRAEVWSGGGAGEMLKTSSVDIREWFLRTEIGLGLVAANQMTFASND